MHMEEDKDLLTGKLENMETGEEWNFEFVPYFSDMELLTIVKVISAESYEDTDEKRFVDVDCHAMDSLGFIYPIVLEFIQVTNEESIKILADMIPDALFAAKGRYGIEDSTMSIHLFDPECIKIDADKNEELVRKAFLINSQSMKKVQ